MIISVACSIGKGDIHLGLCRGEQLLLGRKVSLMQSGAGTNLVPAPDRAELILIPEGLVPAPTGAELN